MTPEHQLKWLFLDLNSYFASVEQQENPALRGRPVAVVPMNTDSTCAIAASYEAKAYGVKTGTKIYEAKRMCPGLVCVLAQHNKYVDYHHRILEEVIHHVPIDRICSIDELSSRLPPRQRTGEAGSAVAERIRKGIWRNVGAAINCSIGLAPNSFLAKVATNMEKPNGLVILAPDALPGRLFDLKLTDLPGINVRMEERLNRAKIRTVEQFWNISPKHARAIWGSVGGERFWYNLHGYDVPDIVTKTSVIGHSRVLDPDLRHPDAARLVTRRLVVKAASRLRRKEFYATCFSMSVRINGDQRWAAEIRLSPAQDNFSFLKALDVLWMKMIADCRPEKIRKSAICLTGLCRREEITPDLFDTNSDAYKKLRDKNDILSGVIDGLNKKYGAETVRIGVSPKTSSGYVGTKIAFARIPDKAEFRE
ncbi:MAG: impB/mucB/samB family protein [Alphaproteobacteria bacterium CG_4_9_14_3_um_filter_47_13]|nr:MAG: impB/mucB/samB family protein [Alphaproteobacteria bacterium CG_4_9_14_3_um_filter_47_13]